MAVIASETFTSTSAPTQYAACVAFDESAEMNDYLDGTRQVLKSLLIICTTSSLAVVY